MFHYTTVKKEMQMIFLFFLNFHAPRTAKNRSNTAHPCGAEHFPHQDRKNRTGRMAAAPAPKTNALAALLGGDDTEKIANPFEQTERRFCRDCKHRVMNAFRIYCSLHDRDVGPMDDCPQYEKRELL